MGKNYYIGLDMGTDSVGWTVTDEEYNIVRKSGKDLWGSFLFEEANPAVERRTQRAARRRLARRKYRIFLLQQLFASEIAKTDPSFFIRLKNSKYFPEDKQESARMPYLLFNDAAFTDKEYFAKYPTIFHLRNALLTEPITDARLLYLAVHHIVKNRGHFLFEGQTFTADQNTGSFFLALNESLETFETPRIPEHLFDEIFQTICDKKMSKSQRKKEIEGLLKEVLAALKADKKSLNQLKAVVSAVCGLNFKFTDIFKSEESFGDISKLDFSQTTEEILDKLHSELNDDCCALLDSLKRIYDCAVLSNILSGQNYISRAKVKSFETHKTHLRMLKEYIEKNCPEMKKQTFRHIKDVNNYAAYIGMDCHKGYKKCSKEDFYAFLKKTVKVSDPEILSLMESGDFMPKQISGENSVIPYQLHFEELQAILKNAEKYFPFLTEFSDGSTTSEKILSLTEFRVPYYVGPLNSDQSQSPHAWIVKKEGKEKCSVTPWNFDDVVDRNASERQFILRMTNTCTYLRSEDVLPESSLLYSEFMVLNDLNNLKVNGEKNPAAKQALWEFAHREKKLTLKKCCAELIRVGILPTGSKAEQVFSGTDGDLKKSLSSYIDLRRILGDRVDTRRDMCEQIILWITIMSDKKRLENLISQEYGDVLSSQEIKQIKALNYTKWGRFCRKFLDGIREIDSDGVLGEKTVIQCLKEGNENLMQLLSSVHGFATAVDYENSQNSESDAVTYKSVEELYCSPLVKRSIWNAVKIVKEIVKIQNCAPKKIFVEVARDKKDDPQNKGRTVSRKRQLMDLYTALGSEGKQWAEEIDKVEDAKFNSDKMFFYYTQMGIDLYTGEKIDLNNVFSTELYDIDHIYPRSKIKDDSLDNRVLVNKTFNQHVKGDRYPLPAEVRGKMLPVWNLLRAKKLISEEKYIRLTRTTPLTAEECAEFINRQLVSTRQSTKATAQLLKQMFPQTTIVYSKAANAAEFKQRLGLVKVRELNDLHHARDAYINIVCGNCYHVRFSGNAREYFRKNNVESYNLQKLYDTDIVGAWRKGDENRIAAIAQKNTCRVVRYCTTYDGKLFDATIEPAENAQNGSKLIPLKLNDPISDTTKYGGYNNASSAYFMLVKSTDKKGKKRISLECVTALAAKQFDGEVSMKEYCQKELALHEPEILIPCVKLNTLLRIDGSYCWLRGRTGSQIVLCNANQLFVEKETVKYLKYISNYLKDRKKYKNDDLPVGEHISAEENLKLYDVLTEKLNMPVYAGLPCSGQVKTLQNGRDAFCDLHVSKQCVALFEILKLMQCNSMLSDLSAIGGSAHAGSNLNSKFLENKDVKIVYQSPTGYYCKTINLADYL